MSRVNGSGWSYQCRRCNYRVTIDATIPAECPSCGASGWWGHLTTNVKSNTSRRKMYAPVKTQPENLSQAEGLEKAIFKGDKLNLLKTKRDKKRGPKPRPVPRELIKQLTGQRLSSRAIAKDLAQRGFHVSYKTVQRVLSSKSKVL